MKKILAGLCILTATCMSGCYKDVILPEAALDPDAPAQAVSFNNELVPMLVSKCALSGCHVSGEHLPYLTADISYQQLVNGGFVNTLLPKESKLYIMINGGMKEYIPSATDRQKIYDWIRNGAPNN